MKAAEPMKKVAMKKAAMKKVAMKKKAAMKAKTIATGRFRKAQVFRGSRVKTTGGLKKTDLKKNKNGKVVSISLSNAGKKNYHRIKAWVVATTKARAALNIKGFVAIKKGTPLYKKAKEIYETSKK